MDYTACSCDNLRKSAFEKAAHDNREDIQAARTLGAAAGLVFHATHERDAGNPDKRNCRTCLSAIGEVIIEAGLRPAKELAPFKEKIRAGNAAGVCGGCDGAGCKAPAFDYSPLR